MNEPVAPPFGPLAASALRNVAPALLLVAGLATGVGKLFQVSGGYAGQSLAVFAGLLLAMSPFLPQHLPLNRFGAANCVTLLRAGIAALLAGWIGRSELASDQSWFVAGLAAFALLLDGIDGWLARRYGTASRFGARFDMEVDAFTILVLAVLVCQTGKAGGWVLLSGAMRYGFVAFGRALPWLNRPLPPRKRRQTVCVIQIIVLTVCLTPPFVAPWATMLAALALGLLTLSFAIDVVWLARQTTPAEGGR